MVLYYGRAKQRTGSVNTKQGLKMSGHSRNIGRHPANMRAVDRRVSHGQSRTTGAGAIPGFRHAAGGVGRMFAVRR